MINVVIVDDHPAVRLGLHTAIQSEPGLISVGVASGAGELAPLLYRSRPDVVILDYHLPDADGLTVCSRIKSDVPAPRVILYSAFADASMIVPALVAGADGLLDKGRPSLDLFDAIREVARGGHAVPAIAPPLLEAAALEPDDRPVLSMLLARTSPHEIAETLRLDHTELKQRKARILERLKVRVP
jgi:DNA-binding NarL/FixJ family response regulator